ncbi:hypothetical protein P8452_64618 [Trifolium repens]|nr:hypothetical protein P8452_64618 [Trifolium repens]
MSQQHHPFLHHPCLQQPSFLASSLSSAQRRVSISSFVSIALNSTFLKNQNLAGKRTGIAPSLARNNPSRSGLYHG